MVIEREELKKKLTEKIDITQKFDLSDLSEFNKLKVSLNEEDWAFEKDDEIKQALSSLKRRA
ncbi:hypothetical protein V7O66_01900 [Methanolobus sp. ZRKC3]|uniref:hypothetical protein n=1 Tax=Methanolobus sp. ZRKC3 TaxID=3125786 RepID=UPI00324F1E4B